ncbi:LEM-3-like GIY-YIG domain-containing protein [Tundrisphaera sp. TA3]|uniref:GIY-YIG nuclease family protein n=1 Tax=Tundrisphaera sp. TA3 TaxID=3435775 RepID=UPI003EB84714
MASELTPKQQRFVEEYLIDLNANQAAIRAGYELHSCGSEVGFYVYLLVDSRNGEIFYVGKGKGQRFKAHEREWRMARYLNTDKCDRIGEIVRDGGRVIAYRFAEGMDEMTAFATERLLISGIGIDRLTNAARGQAAEAERCIEHAKHLLTRIKSFDRWMAERPRTDFEQSLYHGVVEGYRAIASGEWHQRSQQFAHALGARGI